MYGILRTVPHLGQAETTLPPVSLTVQFTPGSSGRRHSLQYAKPSGMDVWDFPQTALARLT
jgi:hypothetical protein